MTLHLKNGRVASQIYHICERSLKKYIHNKNPNKGKFEPHGIEGIFVGYAHNSKAYHIWLTTEKKLIISRDMKTV